MPLQTTYAYDLSGNIVTKTLANGTTENRTHDGRNRVSTLDNQASGGGNVAGYAYGYDKAGNVMEVEEAYPSGELSNRTIVNSYDGVYRLLTEAITTGSSTLTTTYVYDKGHNRTSKAVSGGVTTTYVIGNGSNGAGANQIVSATTGGTTTAYGYDANGNRTSRTIGGVSDAYSYDDENRLINLNYQTGTSGLGTYAYGYDYRTRRVARTEPGTVKTNIVFDGGTSIIEYGSSGAISPNVEYVRGHDYGGGVGGLEYSVRSGTASFNFYDSRGDVTTQTSATGTVTYQAAYEAFGDQTATSGSTLDRQKANTKEEDPTGLLNEGFRYRDPETGTFITRDPLGFKAGPNMYTYVQQNPWTSFDPEGLTDMPMSVLPADTHVFDGIKGAYHAGVAMYNRERSDGMSKTFSAAAGIAYGSGQLTGVSELIEAIAGKNAVTDKKMSPTMRTLTGIQGTAQIVLTLGGALKAPGEQSVSPSPTQSPRSILQQRADDIHSALTPATQSRTTTAVGDATNASGQQVRLVASSENKLRPAQVSALKPGEVPVTGPGHAEATIMNHAAQNNMQVQAVAASRPICANCQSTISAGGAVAASPVRPPPKITTSTTPAQ